MTRRRTDLSAAGFIRVAGDETDALALVFVLRDLSERFIVPGRGPRP